MIPYLVIEGVASATVITKYVLKSINDERSTFPPTIIVIGIAIAIISLFYFALCNVSLWKQIKNEDKSYMKKAYPDQDRINEIQSADR